MFVALSKNHLFISGGVDQDKTLQVNLYTFNATCQHFRWNYDSDKNDEVKNENNQSLELIQLISGCISRQENRFAFADNRKNVFIINDHLKLVLKAKVARNCAGMQFTLDGKRLVYSDKADVYELDLEKQTSKLLLGHCAMLLDFVITHDQKFIISCDRDEKIRVSNYPNTYNISAYCLAHTQFVSCVRWLSKKRLIASGSGDGSVRLWNIQGRQVSVYDFKQQQEEDWLIKSIDVDVTETILLVSFYKHSEIIALQIGDDNSLKKKAKLALSSPPFKAIFDRAHASFCWVFGGHPKEGKAMEIYEIDGEEFKRAFDTKFTAELLSVDAGKKLLQTFQQIDQNADKVVQELFKFGKDEQDNKIDNDGAKRLKC